MRHTANKKLEEQRYEIGEYTFSFAALIRFIELAGSLRKTAPRAFHEMWQCAKDDFSVKQYGSELVRLGMPYTHPWLNDPESLRIAKRALLFFYTERISGFGRTLMWRRSSVDELIVGHELERGMLRLAFLRYE